MRPQRMSALLLAGMLALTAGGLLPGAAATAAAGTASQGSAGDTPARRVFTDEYLVLPSAVAAAAAATAAGPKQQHRRPDEGSLTRALAGHAHHHGRKLQQSSDTNTNTTDTATTINNNNAANITTAPSSTPLNWCTANSLPDGSYPEASDCAKFVLCYSGLTYVFDCADCRLSDRAAAGPGATGGCLGQAKLWFNTDSGVCDWPSAVTTCSDATAAAASDTPTPAMPLAPPPSAPPTSSSTSPGSGTTFRNANEGPYGGYGHYGYGGYGYGGYGGHGGYGGYGGAEFRDSSGNGNGGRPSSSEDDLLIELREGKPYSPVPGYGGGEDGSWSPGSSPDPADLATDLAGSPEDDTTHSGNGSIDGSGSSRGSVSGGGSNSGNGGSGGSSGSGAGSNSNSGGDPCAVPAAGTTQQQQQPLPGAAVAEYSSVFEAPECDGRGQNTCMSSGLAGKGYSGEGAEMDGPNTLYSECADGDPAGGAVGGGGGGGGFVTDVALQAASGIMLRSGEAARVVAQVVCDPAVPATFVDFFYTGYTAMGAAGRVWTYVSTQSCADLQAVDNSTTSNTNATSALLATSLPFTVPDGTAALGGSVAVRVQLRETAGGPVNDLPVAFPCAYGSYGSNDRDDLVVQVCPALPQSSPPAPQPSPSPPPRASSTNTGTGSGTNRSPEGDLYLRGSDGGGIGGSSTGPGWNGAASGTGGAGTGAGAGAAAAGPVASAGQQVLEAARAAFYAIFSAKVPPATGPA